ncbi:MAG: glycosyltransferase family 39 protein [Flavobacteriales bacterium]
MLNTRIQLLERFQRRPLFYILLLALLLRLSAVWNAPGYLMHDDHFLVVEAGASWAVGEDYNNWLPDSQREIGIKNPAPHPANFAYVGIVSQIFRGMNAVSITNPSSQMVLLRLLHALYSLLIVWFGYRITVSASNRKTAIWVGLALAGLALLPNLSVRQLVEMICIPPLMWSTYVIIRKKAEERTMRTWLLAGVGLGLATALRFQCGVFGVGMAAAIAIDPSIRLWRTKIKSIVALAISALFVFSLGQIQDVFIWGEPFTQLLAYFNYNAEYASEYPQGPWHRYLWTLLGLLIPPLSFAWAFGFLKVTKQHAMLVIPALTFFILHSYFSNKQERFIIPTVPFIIIAGTIGWMEFKATSAYWMKRVRLDRNILGVFIILNVILGIGFTCVFSKESRVMAMTTLYEQGDLSNFLAVKVDRYAMPPQFYSGSWENYWTSDLSTDVAIHRQMMCNSSTRAFPNYLLFYGDQHLGEAVEQYRRNYSSMEYVTQIAPGKFDRLLAYLNPINSVERVMIYRIDPQEECEHTPH